MNIITRCETLNGTRRMYARINLGPDEAILLIDLFDEFMRFANGNSVANVSRLVSMLFDDSTPEFIMEYTGFLDNRDFENGEYLDVNCENGGIFVCPPDMSIDRSYIFIANICQMEIGSEGVRWIGTTENGKYRTNFLGWNILRELAVVNDSVYMSCAEAT